MAIPVVCSCGARLKVKAEATGKLLRCPQCGGPFEVAGEVPAVNRPEGPSPGGFFDAVEDFGEEPSTSPAVLTPRRPAAPIRRGASTAAKWAGGLAVSLLVAVAAEVLREMVRPGSSAPAAPRVRDVLAPDELPPAYRLAMADQGDHISRDHPDIADFERLLDQAKPIYRQFEREVADAVIAAKVAMSRAGSRISARELLSGPIEMWPHGLGPGLIRQDFVIAEDNYCMLRQGGTPHGEAVLRGHDLLVLLARESVEGPARRAAEERDKVRREQEVASRERQRIERERIWAEQRSRADAEAAEQVRLADIERRRHAEIEAEALRLQGIADAKRKATVLLSAADRQEQRGDTKGAIASYRDLVAAYPEAPQADHARYRVRELDPAAKNDPAFKARPKAKMTADDKRRDLDHQLAERRREQAAKSTNVKSANDQAAAMAPAVGQAARAQMQAADAAAAEEARRQEMVRRAVFPSFSRP